jgi:hypothetical protein
MLVVNSSSLSTLLPMYEQPVAQLMLTCTEASAAAAAAAAVNSNSSHTQASTVKLDEWRTFKVSSTAGATHIRKIDMQGI